MHTIHPNFCRSFRAAVLPAVAIFLSLQAGWASAQSLRCGGGFSGPGDSKASVVQKCGDPMAVESVCVQQPQPQSMVVTGADGVLRQIWVPQQCMPMEDWTFYRGPGNFLTIVRFKNGTIDSIRDGERAP